MRKKAKRSMTPIRVYDFFSGCGGTSEGFRQAGIKHALAIDSWADAVNTFQKNFYGASVINEPIETINAQRIVAYYSKEPEIKMFCGCAPCQPFTKQKTNTKKNTSEDSRRGLLGCFSAIVHDCLPELRSEEHTSELQSH